MVTTSRVRASDFWEHVSSEVEIIDANIDQDVGWPVYFESETVSVEVLVGFHHQILEEVGKQVRKVPSYDSLLPSQEGTRERSEVDQALEARLRALGYID